MSGKQSTGWEQREGVSGVELPLAGTSSKSLWHSVARSRAGIFHLCHGLTLPGLSPRTLGPCTPSPTTTFGDLRNAKVGQARRRRIPSVAPPPELQDWLRTFQVWLTWWLQAACL